jgi:N-acetylmuramoyl-L-alanine amidase
MKWAAALSLLPTLVLFFAAQEAAPPRLSVYTQKSSFSIVVQQQDGHPYVSLPELLTQLGELNGKLAGSRWKFSFNDVQSEFRDASTQAKVGGSDVSFPYPFYVAGGRLIAPISSLSVLLPQLLRAPVEVHESGQRVFVGGVSTRFSTGILETPSPQVVLTFSAPVNPSIATEPGKLRMVFQREPLVYNGPGNVNLNTRAISLLSYRENNGAAEITLNGNAALLARFSPDRKMITVAPVNQVTSSTAPGAPAQSAAPATNVPAVGGQPPGASPPPPVRPAVVIDPSHGGADPGATLAEGMGEKEITLEIARRLLRELLARGVPAMLLRDSDTNLSTEQRAILANTSRAQLYVTIHAADQGSGVRLYTALLVPSGEEKRGPFLPWDRAQAGFLPASRNLAGTVAAELSKNQLPVRQLSASLQPLNHIATAAVAVEVTPAAGDAKQLRSGGYQEQVSNALATGISNALRAGVAR